MGCNCADDLVQPDPGFNEFLWLVLIVVSFGAIMALLFFLCEILSKTQKKKLEKIRSLQKSPQNKVGYPQLKQPVPVPIPTVSAMVNQNEEATKQKGSLFGMLPPPLPTSKPPSHSLTPVHTRTIPAYPLSPGLVSTSRIHSPHLMSSVSTPLKSSARAETDANVVQKLVGSAMMSTPPKPSRTLTYKPPEKDAPIADHGKVAEQRVTIPPKSDKYRYGYSATMLAEVKQPQMEMADKVQAENSAPPVSLTQATEKLVPKMKALAELQTSAPLVMNGAALKTGMGNLKSTSKLHTEKAEVVATQAGLLRTDNLQASIVKPSTRTTGTETQEIVGRESTFAKYQESNSTALATSIMTRLYRGQQESELLFRQIQSLEKKMELMFIEFGRRNDGPQKVTQGVQTSEVRQEKTAFAQALAAYEASERDTSLETITIESRAPTVRMFDTSRQSIEFKPKVRTTTEIISVEAVPIISSRRSTPIPPLVSSLKMPGMGKTSDSGEDSEDFSFKSDSPDFNRVGVFEVQRNASSYAAEASLLEQKKLDLQNGIETNNFTQLSAYNAGRITDEVSEEILRLKYEKQLVETMTQLRADCLQRLNENQDEQRFLYSQRESGLQKEVGSLSATIESQGSVLASLQWKLSNFEKNITMLSNEKTLLENCAREVKSGWEMDKRIFYEDKERLEGLLDKMRAERQELLKGYQHLVGVKVALDSELVKYKALVDEEELRQPAMPSFAIDSNQGIQSTGQTSEWTFASDSAIDRNDGVIRTTAERSMTEGRRPMTPFRPRESHQGGIMSSEETWTERSLGVRRPVSPLPPLLDSQLGISGQPISSERTFTFYATGGRNGLTEHLI